MGKTFEGGVPTQPEVAAILERWPMMELKPGLVISHHDMQETISELHGTSRYRTVTSRWRELVMRETDNIIGATKKEGFKVLSDSEKAALSGQKFFTAKNYVNKANIIGAKVDTANITKDELARLSANQQRIGKINSLMQIKSKLALPDMTEMGIKSDRKHWRAK